MKILIGVIAVLLLCHSVTKQVVADAPRPNILYFYVDDMGWGSIGPNGQAERRANGEPYVRTPNLDRLAREGVNFVRGYGCHVCSPARSSQQSGFHQGHTFADRNDPNNAKKAMRADDVLIGDALSAAGYVTGYWGKWGYGGSKDLANPVVENIQTLPTSHGYQFVLAELHHVRAHTFFQPTLWQSPARSGASGGLELVPNSMRQFRNSPSYPSTPAQQNHANYPEIAYCDDSYAMAALDFVREQAQVYNQSAQPFFGLLAVQIPHAPFGEVATLPEWDHEYAGDPEFAKLSEQTRQWAAMVTRIDAHFGNILDALEDPNNDGDTSDSIVDNTLVVFQSDNGGPSGKNNTELDANGGLRGNKGSIFEGGIRVPLVMRWPAKINEDSLLNAGTASNRIIDVTDLCPTFCELAGTPQPLGVDGVSIAPTLLSSGHQRQRDFIIHEASNGQSIIRGRHKLIRFKKEPPALYDLESDKAEKHNIAKQHPELIQELETLLIGERVTEPAGFATTYHRWTGNSEAKTSDPKNWSDYEYENAGVTYMRDAGPPKLSWIARVENTEKNPSSLRVTEDLEVLGLEVSGTAAQQTLIVGEGTKLNGRNEIRLSKNAELQLRGGTVASLRWVDVHRSASLTGTGTIEADVFNAGLVSISGRLTIHADYYQAGSGRLDVSLDNTSESGLQIDGEAHLDGMLSIVSGSQDRYTLIRAERIDGKFENPGDKVVSAEGVTFKIGYANGDVTLRRVK